MKTLKLGDKVKVQGFNGVFNGEVVKGSSSVYIPSLGIYGLFDTSKIKPHAL